MSLFTHARVLVDWHNVQKRVDEKFYDRPRKNIPALILRIQQQCSVALSRLDSSVRFRVALRIYYGWHQRREATNIRHDFELFRFDESFARRIGSVSFLPGFEFGNELCCYDDILPIFDTYRGGGQEKGQKMVDTAISCDTLHLARNFPELVSVIVSDDDDFLPVVITSKKWRSKTVLIRVESKDLSFVTDEPLDGLVHYWSDPS